MEREGEGEREAREWERWRERVRERGRQGSGRDGGRGRGEGGKEGGVKREERERREREGTALTPQFSMETFVLQVMKYEWKVTSTALQSGRG